MLIRLNPFHYDQPPNGQPWPRPHASYGRIGDNCYRLFDYVENLSVGIFHVDQRSVRRVVVDWVEALCFADLVAVLGEQRAASLRENLAPTDQRIIETDRSFHRLGCDSAQEMLFISMAAVARDLKRGPLGMSFQRFTKFVEVLTFGSWVADIYLYRCGITALYDAFVDIDNVAVELLEEHVPTWSPEQAATPGRAFWMQLPGDKNCFVFKILVARSQLEEARVARRRGVGSMPMLPPRDVSVHNGVHRIKICGREAWGLVVEGYPYLDLLFVFRWLGLAELVETDADIGTFMMNMVADASPPGLAVVGKCADGKERTLVSWPLIGILAKFMVDRQLAGWPLDIHWRPQLLAEGLLREMPETEISVLVALSSHFGLDRAEFRRRVDPAAAGRRRATVRPSTPRPPLTPVAKGSLAPVVMPELGAGFSKKVVAGFDAETGTVWLSQQQMAKVFGLTQQSMSRQIQEAVAQNPSAKEIYKDFRITANNGKDRRIACYELNFVFEVGMQFESAKADIFRVIASRKLAELTMRGVAVNDLDWATTCKGILDGDLIYEVVHDEITDVERAEIVDLPPVPRAIMQLVLPDMIDVRAFTGKSNLFLPYLCGELFGPSMLDLRGRPMDDVSQGEVLLAARKHPPLLVVVDRDDLDLWREFLAGQRGIELRVHLDSPSRSPHAP